MTGSAATINGGRLYSSATEVDSMAIYNNQGSNLTINGGTIEGAGRNIYIKDATLKVTGGNFASALDYMIFNVGGNVELLGGTYSGNKGLYNSGYCTEEVTDSCKRIMKLKRK